MAKRKTSTRRGAKRGTRQRASAIEIALAGVAHDLRTPLTGILALAELLASSDLGEQQRQWAEAVKSGAEHLSALTTLIVDAARSDAAGLVLRRETFPPRRLAEAVGRAFAARAQAANLTAKVTIARSVPAAAAGDPLRLRAALENLADNAVKFTGSGMVAMTATAEPATRGRLRLVFTFRDSGIGLTPQDVKRLFRPFAQASETVARRYGGAGLGLVFVRRLARAMGGDLTVESTPGRGSTFRLSVMVERAALRPAPGTVRRAGARGRALRVLCAEDNAYGRVVMNTVLTELGHKADFVESGEAAVKAVAAGRYDAVLMDVTLPGIDGIDAARRIRALPGAAGRTPIIGISGRSENGHEDAARAAGMDGYFVKPVSPAMLAAALARLP